MCSVQTRVVLQGVLKKRSQTRSVVLLLEKHMFFLKMGCSADEAHQKTKVCVGFSDV